MKTCPVCSLRYEDVYQFCAEDGYELKSAAGEEEFSRALLRCRACSTEYPLTFDRCPIDGAPLAPHREIRTAKPAAAVKIDESPEPARPIITAPPEPSFLRIEEPRLSVEEAQERPGLRVAAAAIILALILAALAGLYLVYSNLRRGPQSTFAPQVKSAPQKEEASLVETPDAARDYTEQAPVDLDDQPTTVTGDGVEKAEQAVNNPVLPKTSKVAQVEARDERSKPVGQQPQRAAPAAPSINIAELRAPVISQSTDNRISARLVRVRARRSAAGYGYDMTFTLREESGRPVYLSRISVFTRSESGRAHTEFIPFPYTLNPSGVMTFTITVDMPGATEADWRGRIACTSAGVDKAGKAIRASFGANVAPW